MKKLLNTVQSVDILPVLENEKNVPEIELNNKNKPKKKHDIRNTIGVMIGFVITSFFTPSLFKPSLDRQFVEAANELNKNCPMNVDVDTVLENVVTLPNKTFQYNYVLIRYTKVEVKIDTVKKYIFPGI